MKHLLTEENNIMVDLETLSKGSNAAIVSIGAVRFNLFGVLDDFYSIVNLESCISAGLEMDASTVLWWLKQSDEARLIFSEPGSPLTTVLSHFSQWTDKDAIIWGNGATFDNVILSNAYDACNMKRPWSYKNDRCYRTVRAGFPDVESVRSGTHHNALDDARNQAETLIKCLKEN